MYIEIEIYFTKFCIGISVQTQQKSKDIPVFMREHSN